MLHDEFTTVAVNVGGFLDATSQLLGLSGDADVAASEGTTRS